jgi:hypothetical protein
MACVLALASAAGCADSASCDPNEILYNGMCLPAPVPDDAGAADTLTADPDAAPAADATAADAEEDASNADR